MHMVEHILLRPQELDQHGFQLESDQERVYFLESYEYGDTEKRESTKDDLVTVGTYRENYNIQKDENGAYTILLANNQDVFIAKHPGSFKTEEEAREKMVDIIDYIRSFKRSNTSIYDKIQNSTRDQKESTTEVGDFYSLTLSVILPTWPSRFQNSDFRDLLHNIIILNAPVYVHIDFQWLDIKQMGEFEAVYFGWLKERIEQEPRQPELDQKAQKVMNLLLHNH